MDDEYGPVVASFTRAEAFEKGAFIAISPAATSAAGITMPLIMTSGAHREFVAGSGGAEEEGRLRTVLDAVAAAITLGPLDEVCFVVPAGDLPSGQASTGSDRLIAIIEPGDTGEPLLTLMLPAEM